MTVSIVIPTFKRPQLLRRAVASVFAQTHEDWRLYISDDEDAAGETWDYLQTLARTDPRIHVMRNRGEHGQCGNVNNLLRVASGEWVKPLWDDDVLKPECLEVFLEAVAGRPSVAMAACAADHFVNGELTRRFDPAGLSPIEIIERPYVHLGWYLQERIGGGIPTQTMVRGSIVAKGVHFTAPPGITTAVDSLWYARICEHGDLMAINRALVEEHQGEHQTVTSCVAEEELDRQFMLLRRFQLERIDPNLNPPSLKTVEQMLKLIRAMNRLSKRRVLDAGALAAGCWRPRAWMLAMRWMIQRRRPYALSSVKRTFVSPVATLSPHINTAGANAWLNARKPALSPPRSDRR